MNIWLAIFGTLGWVFALLLFIMCALMSASVMATRAEVSNLTNHIADLRRKLSEARQPKSEDLWKVFLEDYGRDFKKKD